MCDFKIAFIRSVLGCMVVGLVSIGMSGCSGTSVSPMQQDKLLSFGIADIEKNVQDVKDARNKAKLDFYSPKNLSAAEAHAYKAMSMHKDKDDKSAIYEEVKLSKHYLAKGYSSKSIIDKELKNILIYKQKLDILHAEELFNDEYSDISENIADMISDIEDGEGIKSFENREQTLVDSKILYSKIKVSSNLHSVEEILKLVDQNIVPQSYQKANTAYINAKFTINKFPDDEKIIKEKTREALDEALYAQTIEMESKKLIGLEENVELFVRDQHEKLNIIFTSLDNKNQKFKTLSYSSKISKLRNDILKIIDDRKSLKSKNKNLISNANINKKTIVDLDERVEQQTLKINSLEAKVQNSNEQLLKSKDGALDANTKLIELQNEITLLKATVDKEKKSTQDRDKIILDSKETISKLNQKINTTNNKLKKELKNSSKLSDALEDKELIIKALKSKNKNLIAKSEKEVVKEVVKETTTEE